MCLIFPPRPLQIDVLQAEVQALKTLVLSSPTSPLGELPSTGGVKTPFRKGHSRNKSTSSAIMGTQPDPSATQPIVRECREVGGARRRYTCVLRRCFTVTRPHV